MDGVISRRGVSVPPFFAAFVNSYHNVFLNAISHTRVPLRCTTESTRITLIPSDLSNVTFTRDAYIYIYATSIIISPSRV